jgi:hypothetical protein
MNPAALLLFSGRCVALLYGISLRSKKTRSYVTLFMAYRSTPCTMTTGNVGKQQAKNLPDTPQPDKIQ